MIRPTLLLAIALLPCACRSAADVLVRTQPPRGALELRAIAGSGDTSRVTLNFVAGASGSVGSVTAALSGEGESWRFVSCTPRQGDPLIACFESGGRVRVAAAWAAGAHEGALVEFAFVRAAGGTASGARPAWQLSVSEVHGATGRSLADSLGIRKEVQP